MPVYTFRNKETGETHDELMSYDASLEYLKENPELEKDITGSFPAMHSGIGLGLRKPDEAFKDILSNMKKNHNHRGGKINDHR